MALQAPDIETGGVRNFTGTSASAPAVAAVAAKVMQVNPQLSGEQVKRIIMEAAMKQKTHTGHIISVVTPESAKAAVKLATGMTPKL